MKALRIGTAALLVCALSGAPAFAGGLRESASAAATAAAKADSQETRATEASVRGFWKAWRAHMGL